MLTMGGLPRWMLCCRDVACARDRTIDPAAAGAGRCGADPGVVCAVGDCPAVERENSVAVPRGWGAPEHPGHGAAGDGAGRAVGLDAAAEDGAGDDHREDWAVPGREQPRGLDGAAVAGPGADERSRDCGDGLLV